MQLLSIDLPAGATTVEPRVAPAAVPVSHIRKIPKTLASTDAPPSFVYLALESTAAVTAVIEVFVRDEAAVLPLPEPGPQSTDQWYRIQDGATTSLTVVVGVMDAAVKFPIFSGSAYFRVTTGPVGDPATLKIGIGPSIGTI